MTNDQRELADELAIGQVQWHSSEEDGGPDVGILMRIDADHHLWWGGLLAGEGDGFGAVIYGPGGARTVFEPAYDELRQVFEDYVAPALRTRPEPTPSDGLADELTSALRIGVEDDVTIPFDLAVRIHGALLHRVPTPTASEEAVEAKARELCAANFAAKGCEDEIGGSVDDCWWAFKDEARAAIAALSTPVTTPDGKWTALDRDTEMRLDAKAAIASVRASPPGIGPDDRGERG